MSEAQEPQEPHNENTRVQVPAILHLIKLGYNYFTDDFAFDDKTNILIDVFKDSLKRLNPDMTDSEIQQQFDEVVRILNNDDLGREFFNKLISISGTKFIDFNDSTKNVYHCTSEFTCRNVDKEKEFRPDITCFINGLPIAFIECKIPNNHEGMMAESDRTDWRMSKDYFRRFFNITQLMIFSNNQEYLLENRDPIQGTYYATPTNGHAFFNVFREKNKEYYNFIKFREISEEEEKKVLIHRNCPQLRAVPEYETNKNPLSPLNRVISSMLAINRILFFIRYGIAYVEQTKENENGEQYKELQKHIMRYQQMFAAQAIRKRIEANIKSGIIWHTQGSGKTALAYYSVRYLIDYFSKNSIVAKFYFIVDRLDLMLQAQKEFAARGLKVRTAESRDELMKDFKDSAGVKNSEGKTEIMVVNIQKFEEDHNKVTLPNSYNINLQRIFFIDEAHRGYKFEGSFLANLMDADRNAIKIALTGTPLIDEEKASRLVFGDYIDTYYYDKSIEDGYTLKLMREIIETSYKEKLLKLLEEKSEDVKVKSSDINNHKVIESENYLKELIKYISNDLKTFRIAQDDNSVAGMVVCETNPQAEKLFELFKKSEENESNPLKLELILHDVGSKDDREKIIDTYKKTQNLDILIVNKMLLTGFDAPRLKKLYLTRKMDGHDLLQALTRVNRPYKKFQYGYVVDFAGIKENFDATNNRYLKELSMFDGYEEDDPEKKTKTLAEAILENPEDVVQKAKEFANTMFAYTCENIEIFRQELDEIDDKEKLYEIRKVLENAQALGNAVRVAGDDELKEKIKDFNIGRLPTLIREVQHRIDRVNELEASNHESDVSAILNLALSEMEYHFDYKGKEELKIYINDLKEKYENVLVEINRNFDKKEDQKYVDIVTHFRAYFRKKGFVPDNVKDAKESIGYMDEVMKKIREINRQNEKLKKKYLDDERFTRIHKRIMEENERRKQTNTKPIISDTEIDIAINLNKIKTWIDERVYHNYRIMENKEAFNQDVLSQVSQKLHDLKITATIDDRKFIRNKIANEYLNQYNDMIA